MEVEIKSFDKLSTAELYEILWLRSAVFVLEQNCLYQDMDGKDQKAIHVLGKTKDSLTGYLRIFKPGDYFDETSIGRVVVHQNHRGRGLAKQLMENAMVYIESNFGKTTIELSAQTYLIGFYNDLGFVEKGEEYLEDGIPHIKMIYN